MGRADGLHTEIPTVMTAAKNVATTLSHGSKLDDSEAMITPLPETADIREVVRAVNLLIEEHNAICCYLVLLQNLGGGGVLRRNLPRVQR